MLQWINKFDRLFGGEGNAGVYFSHGRVNLIGEHTGYNSGHVKALKKIEENPGLKIYNLGTGMGYSVLDVVKNFEAATGEKIPYVIK